VLAGVVDDLSPMMGHKYILPYFQIISHFGSRINGFKMFLLITIIFVFVNLLDSLFIVTYYSSYHYS
jgi:hypothetical protein